MECDRSLCNTNHVLRRLVDCLSYDTFIGLDWAFVQASVVLFCLVNHMVSDNDADVKMWHVGVHIWEIPPNDIEPNYEEYYQVRIPFPYKMAYLIALGPDGVQSDQHSDPTTCESVDYTPPTTSWLGHRVDEEGSIRHTLLYRRKRSYSMVSVHLYLPAADRKHVETADIWRAALHGSTSNGRDADLGHLCESAQRSTHLSYSLYYRSPHDECEASLSSRGAGGIHLQLSVSSCRLHWDNNR